MYKETAVRLVPKEHLQILKDDNGFVRHIVHDISTDLAERFISILNAEREIIVRQSDLRVEEQKMLNQVEYRKNIMWTPLVRCGECKHWSRTFITRSGSYYCPMADRGTDPEWYCADGEHREEEHDETV